MEKNTNKLKEALAKLPSSGPSDFIWKEIETKLNEIPLKKALEKLPEFEPNVFVWDKIESKTPEKRPKNQMFFWYAAAVILISGFAGFRLLNQSKSAGITYSEEVVDLRLQIKNEEAANDHYETLVAYCEAETVVCNTKNFKRLQQEYETLRMAADQLQQAMGTYNTEPELIRQFSIVEQEKAEILNKMAKMI